jgi:hypothetical protein
MTWAEKLSSIKTEWILIVGLVIFLGISIHILGNYGMNVDSAKNYREGKANLDFLLTGQVNQGVLLMQTHGAFFFMVADISKRLFSDTLHLLDPLAAHRVMQPFLVAS